MKSELNILILPVRMLDEDDACSMNEIFTSFPNAAAPKMLRSTMREVILSSAWVACRQLPHGRDMNLDVMMRRRPLVTLNGRPC
jgi:hypothetical protein